jgi:hypothetical protein
MQSVPITTHDVSSNPAHYILQKEELDLLKGKSDKDLWEEDLELFLKTLDVSHE